jgi:hypothetical protein
MPPKTTGHGLTILLSHPAMLLILIAAIIVAVGLTAGLASVRPVDSRVHINSSTICIVPKSAKGLLS